MNEVLVAADMTTICADYLRDNLTATVGTVITDERPLVIVQRIGGARRSVVIDLADMQITCFAELAEDADDLAQQSRALLYAMGHTVQSGTTIYEVTDVDSVTDEQDPLTYGPTSQFAVEIASRLVAQ